MSLGGFAPNLTAKISQSERSLLFFRFCKSMTRDARGERGLSHGSFTSASSSEEPGYLFTYPESWIPRDWQSPLNRAPTKGPCYTAVVSKTIRCILALQLQFLPTRRLPLVTDNASSVQSNQTTSSWHNCPAFNRETCNC